MFDPASMRWRLYRSVTAALIATAPYPVGANFADSPPQLVSRLTAAEMAYLRERMNRDGFERQMDRHVTDAMGLTRPSGAPLAFRGLGLTNPSHGDGYFLMPLPDGRLLIGRREWTGRISYWLLLSGDFALERAVLAVSEGAAALRAEQAEAERRRILAFFRSNVPSNRR